MLLQDLFKKPSIFHAPGEAPKGPEEQKKAPEKAKADPNDMSKKQNREKLYADATALIAKLEKKGDDKSKKQAEALKKILDAAKSTEITKDDASGKLMFDPKESAAVLKTQLDAILIPENGMVFAEEKVVVKRPKAKPDELAEARSFGMIGLLQGEGGKPSETFTTAASKLDGKSSGDPDQFEKELAASIQKPKNTPVAKIEVGQIVITASPTNQHPKPYNILSTSLSSIPMTARVEAKNYAAAHPNGGERYYAATDGKFYRVQIDKAINGQNVLHWNRIEKQEEEKKQA